MANMNVLLPSEMVVTAEIENDFVRDLLTPHGGTGTYCGVEMLDAVDMTEQSLRTLGIDYEIDTARTDVFRENTHKTAAYVGQAIVQHSPYL